MRIKMSISGKMLLYILVTTVLVYSAAVGYISIYARKMASNEIKEVTDSYASQFAYKIKSDLDADFSVVKTLTKLGENFKKIPLAQFQKVYLETEYTLILNNPDYLSVATSWEIKGLDSTWPKAYGRRLSGYYREGGQIKYLYKELNMDGDVIGSNYYNMKLSGQSSIFDPEFYSYTGRKEDEVINTNISVPIMYNSHFVGLAGIDMDMQKFKKLIGEIKPFTSSYGFLLSNSGNIIAHPNIQFTGKFFDKIYPEMNVEYFVQDQIKLGKHFSFLYKDKTTGVKTYYSFAPIEIRNVVTPWSVAIAVPASEINKRANSAFYFSIIVGLLGLIVMGIVIFFISRMITRPLIQTTGLLKNLALGKIDKSKILKVNTGDEMGQMADSVNKLMEGLDRTARFAKEIGEGNLNADFVLLSEEDIIGTSLIEMRKSLVKAKHEEEKRKTEEEKQKWITTGITHISEILRQNNNDLRKLSFEIMKNLIEYLDATQGAIYIYNDHDTENPFFELTAAIAYGRNRTQVSQILPGEGMVGRCAFEKATIYMTQVPKDYTRITSGLGTANPTCILLVPLKLNDEVLGVLEFASFKKLEDYMVEFTERIAESIASTISSVKINEKTAMLLHQSQEQADMLSQQEEEMRQNMEEMHATQEEAIKRESEMKAVIDSIYDISLVAEFDLTGKIININDNFIELLGASREQMLGRQQGSFSDEKDHSEEQNLFWNDLRNGITRHKIQKVYTSTGQTLWLSEIYAPIPNVHGELYKVINIAVDITENMHQKH